MVVFDRGSCYTPLVSGDRQDSAVTGKMSPGYLAAPKSNIRFGPFELDISTGELSKEGSRIRLQEQPFQILLMLLEKRGDLVLRDEIRSRLWQGNTVVEFDHSINAAVKRLRNALRDNGSKPR